LLLPALSRSKFKAHQVTCLGNVRQLNYAAFVYDQDQNKGLPGTWADAFWVRPFLRDQPALRGVLHCPVAKERRQTPVRIDFDFDNELAKGRTGTAANCWWWQTPTVPLEEWTGSYAMNGYFSSKAPFPSQFSDPVTYASYFRSLSAVEHPVTTPVFVDGAYPAVWPQPASNVWYTADPFTGLGFAAPIARHASRSPNDFPRFWPMDRPPPRPWAMNIAFADGHAEAVKMLESLQLTWHRSYVPPTKLPW
ncbi:MAG TPA: hypothetical protein VK327_04150, partial [Candidatus Paceibacterota bacterium]|nr:hypothetical protein [Candidatus Paceibacterota bacterium]